MGSVQEPLHKLLCAEAIMQERNCCTKEKKPVNCSKRPVDTEAKSSRPLVEKAGASQRGIRVSSKTRSINESEAH